MPERIVNRLEAVGVDNNEGGRQIRGREVGEILLNIFLRGDFVEEAGKNVVLGGMLKFHLPELFDVDVANAAEADNGTGVVEKNQQAEFSPKVAAIVLAEEADFVAEKF